MQKYAIDHAYIFECEPEHLNDSEAATIRELAPMYNYDHNPHAGRIRQISVQGPAETNLISSAAYGQHHGKSREQVKQYCHGNRIHGAVRIGRDWVIPRDSRFPEDHRKMGSK